MFQLEAAIRQWKSSQRSNGESLDTGTLDELESHLRDQIDAFREKGCLSDEEAYLLARRRLGDPEALDREFSKEGAGLQWTRRFFWMLAGYFGISGLSAIAIAAGGAARTTGVLASGGAAPVAAAVGGAVVTLLTGVGLCALVVRLLRNDEAPPSRIARFLRDRPVALAAGAGLVLAGKGAFLSGTSVYLSRQVPIASMGSLNFASSMSWAAVNCMFFLVLAIALVVTRRKGWRRRAATS